MPGDRNGGVSQVGLWSPCEAACLILQMAGNLRRDLNRGITSSNGHFIYFFKLKKFFNLFIIIVFLAVLGLHCCTRAFSGCSERRQLFVVVQGLLTAVASLVAEHGL